MLLPALLALFVLPLRPAAAGGAPAPAAQSSTPATDPSATTPQPSPRPAPGPIVPRGNPLGKVGVVAMAVAAAAGLWIYRVIRKGL
jgi:hypothetical protein